MRVGSREGMEVKDVEWVWRTIEVEMEMGVEMVEEVEWVWRRGGVRGEDENRDGDGEQKRRGVEVEEGDGERKRRKGGEGCGRAGRGEHIK